MKRTLLLVAAVTAAAPLAAHAEVAEVTAAGFTARGTVRAAVPPRAAWDRLVQLPRFWDGEHTYSGDPANLSLEPVAGGCFCESIPANGGSIEHARVIYAVPGEVLRLRGSLGPLQSEALNGTLTVTLKPTHGGTELEWEYVVGGYARFSLEQTAPLVDSVIGAQFVRLGDLLGRLAD